MTIFLREYNSWYSWQIWGLVLIYPPQVEDEDKYQPVSDDPMSNLILEAIKNDDLRKMERAKKWDAFVDDEDGDADAHDDDDGGLVDNSTPRGFSSDISLCYPHCSLHQ